MKTNIKQKQPTLQKLIDELQAGGGGGTVDAYTKAEADAKFETQTHAAATYQPKADMTDYVEEKPGGYIVVNGIRLYVSSTAPTGDIPENSLGIGFDENGKVSVYTSGSWT